MLLLGGLCGLLVSLPADAIPAYARQTGSACADCHAGAYGPALTPYGMRFKLNGYTDTDGQGLKIPLAAQLIGTHAVPERGDSSTRLTEADIFIAGRLNDHFGGFAKVETDNDGHNNYNTKLSNLDLRFVAKDLNLGKKDAMFGVSVNNSPGFQDAIGALPNAASLGPPAVSGTLLNPSSAHALANRVLGATAYGFYDAQWYAELGTYSSMQPSVQDDLGYNPNGDPGKLSGTSYLRLAWMKDLKRQFVSIGIVTLDTTRKLPRSAAGDDITDLGYDLTYQFLGNREHIAQISYVNIYEKRQYGSTPVVGALSGLPHGSARDRTLSLTYTFRQSYGVNWVHLVSTGSHDPVRYPPFGNPDTTSDLYSLFWAPFGKDDSWTTKANLKIAATWFRFSKFNGRSSNIFGVPPGSTSPVTNAHDLDQFSLIVSLAF
nr:MULTISPECIES: cytochrome C [Dyella]